MRQNLDNRVERLDIGLEREAQSRETLSKRLEFKCTQLANSMDEQKKTVIGLHESAHTALEARLARSGWPL